MQSCFQGMVPVRLRSILPEAQIFAGENHTFGNCVCDSRRVKAGDVFVALRGHEVDGHDFIEEALQKGAAAIVAERPTDNPFHFTQQGEMVPFYVVSDTHRAYARMCQAIFGFPGEKLNITGITGTCGKTMTACLVAGVLGAAGFETGILGSLGAFDGLDASSKPVSSLPPKRVASWFVRMLQNQCTHAVVEASSIALEKGRVGGFSLQTLCMTNVLRHHLDYHGSLEAYRKAKMRIFEALAPDGVAILNADDPILAEAIRFLQVPILTYGIEQDAAITAVPVEQYDCEQTVLVSAGGETLPLRTKVVGNAHIYHCLTAVAVGLRLGIPLTTVIRGIESVETIPGRMERLECGQPFRVFVDFSRSADELQETLASLREVVRGRIHCVFGASENTSTAERAQFGGLLERNVDEVILTDANPGNEPSEKILHEVLAGINDPKSVTICPSRRDAIALGLSHAESGDAVLLAGKGNEKFQAKGGDFLRQDDRETARKWLLRNVERMTYSL